MDKPRPTRRIGAVVTVVVTVVAIGSCTTPAEQRSPTPPRLPSGSPRASSVVVLRAVTFDVVGTSDPTDIDAQEAMVHAHLVRTGFADAVVQANEDTLTVALPVDMSDEDTTAFMTWASTPPTIIEHRQVLADAPEGSSLGITDAGPCSTAKTADQCDLQDLKDNPTYAASDDGSTMYYLGPSLTTTDLYASARVVDQDGIAAVDFTFSPEGAAEWNEVTAGLSGQRIALLADQKVLAVFPVNGPVSEAGTIGGLTAEEAASVAAILDEDSLPFMMFLEAPDPGTATAGFDGQIPPEDEIPAEAIPAYLAFVEAKAVLDQKQRELDAAMVAYHAANRKMKHAKKAYREDRMGYLTYMDFVGDYQDAWQKQFDLRGELGDAYFAMDAARGVLKDRLAVSATPSPSPTGG